MEQYSTPSNSIPIEKEDLFFALVRIYLLMDDIDPNNDIDTMLDDVDFVGITEFNDEDDEDPTDDAPDYFQTLLMDKDEPLFAYRTKTLDEYIGLFALLTSPLEADPLLKKEFQEYALTKHGVEIEFFTYHKKPKLMIVSSKKDDTPPSPTKPPAT